MSWLRDTRLGRRISGRTPAAARRRLYGDGAFAIHPTRLLPRMLREIPGVEVELRLPKLEPTPMPERSAAG